MKRLVLGAATLALVAWAVAVAIVAERAPGREDTAADAAMGVMQGNDPSAGIGASCDYEPGLESALLRARYSCRLYDCFDEVFGRLEVEDRPGKDWGYRVERDPGWVTDDEGTISPASFSGETLDEEGCPEEARGLLQHELEVYMDHLLSGRPEGHPLRRALAGLSITEIAHAKFKVIDVDLDDRTARVRAGAGGEVRVLEARLVGAHWRIAPP